MQYYIRNTETDENFDPIENKFYSNSWQPQLEEDRDYLEMLMKNDKERFENCIIEEV